MSSSTRDHRGLPPAPTAPTAGRRRRDRSVPRGSRVRTSLRSSVTSVSYRKISPCSFIASHESGDPRVLDVPEAFVERIALAGCCPRRRAPPIASRVHGCDVRPPGSASCRSRGSSDQVESRAARSFPHRRSSHSRSDLSRPARRPAAARRGTRASRRQRAPASRRRSGCAPGCPTTRSASRSSGVRSSMTIASRSNARTSSGIARQRHVPSVPRLRRLRCIRAEMDAAALVPPQRGRTDQPRGRPRPRAGRRTSVRRSPTPSARPPRAPTAT